MSYPRPDIVFGPFNEGTTPVLTGVLRDESGALIPGSALDTKTWTLRNEHTGAIVNSRDSVTAGLSIDESGNLTLSLAQADTVVADRSRSQEWRRLLVAWTFNAGHRGTLDARVIIDRTEVDA